MSFYGAIDALCGGVTILWGCLLMYHCWASRRHFDWRQDNNDEGGE